MVKTFFKAAVLALALTACTAAREKTTFDADTRKALAAKETTVTEATTNAEKQTQIETVTERTTADVDIDWSKGKPLEGHPGFYIRGEDFDSVGIYDENGNHIVGGYVEIKPAAAGLIKVRIRVGMADSRGGVLNGDFKPIIAPNYYYTNVYQYGGAVFVTAYPPLNGHGVICDIYDSEGNVIEDLSGFITQNAGDGYNGEMSLWAAGEVCEAVGAGIIPENIRCDHKTPITRREFCNLAVNTYCTKGKTGVASYVDKDEKPFSDTDDINVAIAYRLGLVSGTGEGRFSPDKPITRQEAAVMLYNLAKLLGLKQTEGSGKNFIDDDHFADWAFDSVYNICQYVDINGRAVMSGKGDGKFSPWNYYTREEAAATMVRICKCDFNKDYRTVLFADLKEIGNSYKIGHYRESLLTDEGLKPYFEKWDKLAKTAEQKNYVYELENGVEHCMRYYAKCADYINEHGGDRAALEQTVNKIKADFFERADDADPVKVKVALYMTDLNTTFGVNGTLAVEAADMINSGKYLSEQ